MRTWQWNVPAWLGLSALLAGAPSASAQALVGRVVDAESGVGVVGAIVAALAGADDVRARTLTLEGGGFSLRLPVGFEPDGLRVERIGYGPQTFPLGRDRDSELIVLRVTPRPIQLEAITATAESLCGRDVRRDRVVHDVWQEARKSLQAQELSLEERILTFDTETLVRSLDPRTRAVLEQSSRQRRLSATRPYRAISVEQMTSQGWAEDSPGGGTVFYAPDATLLLAEEFTSQHCFAVERSEEGILLAFEPNQERRRLPELEGTMILHPTSLELTKIRFRYVGLPSSSMSQYAAEGEVGFYAAPNGLRIVQEWAIRMPVGTVLRSSFGGQRIEGLRIDYLREEGGRVLRVRTRSGDLLLGPAGPATGDLTRPLAERLVTWSAEDESSGGVALFLRNELPVAIVVTGIELRNCANVALNCAELQPVLVPLGIGQEARLFVVPREDLSSRIDFIWNFTATNEDPPYMPAR
jgi:hypothetical protein